MELSNLRPAEGSKHSDNFRRGRGHGSGNGKTAGKGHKGQLARSGHKKPGFEGGQMPLYRRLPKRGFKNRNTKEIIAIPEHPRRRLRRRPRRRCRRCGHFGDMGDFGGFHHAQPHGRGGDINEFDAGEFRISTAPECPG